MGFSFDVVTFVFHLWGTVLASGIIYVAYIYYIRYLYYKLKYTNISSGDIYQIDHLDSERFFVLLVRLFEREGYIVKKINQKDSTEEELDFILVKASHKTAVLKHHTLPRYRVGSRGVMILNNLQSIYNCDEAIIITNGFFTPKAQEVAKDNQISLCDRDTLLGMISKLRLNKPSKIAKAA